MYPGPNWSSPQEQETQQMHQQGVALYLARVMGWMCVGLLTTFTFALLTVALPNFHYFLMGTKAMYVIFIAQVGCVLALTASLPRLSPTGATAMFLVYSTLTGITFSSLFLLFDSFSLILVFGLCAFLFLGMFLYGMFSHRDLTRMGTLAMFALFGLILATVINWFLGSSWMDFLICLVGIGLFLALTAYDTQKIKQFYFRAIAQGSDEDGPQLQKLAIYGALTLYLDFINLFLKLLRLFGKRRD